MAEQQADGSKPPTNNPDKPDSDQPSANTVGESVVEAGTEAVEPPPPDVIQLCIEAFQKTANYFKGEVEGTCEDYKLLEQMNRVAISKYAEMKQTTLNISSAIQELNEKSRCLQPYLDQIDQIEENVTSLEQAAYRLDAYSKRLESKFKQLERR